MNATYSNMSLLLCACLSALTALATTRYVSPAGSHIAPFTNWTTAATSIQPAVDVAVSGDEILVTNGVYSSQGSTFDGGCVVLCTNDISIRSVHPRGAIINGSGVQRGAVVNNCGNATLDGFVIANCYTTDGGGGRLRGGAGIYIMGGNGVLVTNCHIVNNVSQGTYAGGGIFMEDPGNRTIANCVIEKNTAISSGGGIRAENGGVISACVFSDNRAAYGGGLYLFSTGTVRNCLFVNNTATTKGGGVYFDYDDFIANNNSTKASLENCTVVGNYSPDIAGVVFARQAQVVNSIIIGNQGVNYTNFVRFSFTNSCAYPLPRGANNISNDPMFLSASTLDFRLATNSPCRNTGTNQPWMAGAQDLAGNSRISESVVDRGCYELGVFACNFTATPQNGLAPLKVILTATLSGTNTSNVAYYWDFNNDGSNEMGGVGLAIVTNVYPVEGRYSVRIAATNAAGDGAGWVAHDYIYAFNTNIHYVSLAGSNVFPYTSWANAANTVADAVSAALDGHSVIITNGLYQVDKQITIDHAITIKSVNGRDATTLFGTATNRCFFVDAVAAVVDGLTISNCNVNINGPYNSTCFGGGVYLNRAGIVQNSRITQCKAANGGGAYLYYGGTLSNCIVAASAASHYGGGIACYALGTVVDCDVFQNVMTLSGWSGAGIAVMQGAGALIGNCDIHDNTSYSHLAGGLHLEHSTFVTNCRVYNNVAQRDAAGIYVYANGTRIVDCLISNNVSTLTYDGNGQGGGVYLYAGGILQNSIICNNFSLDGGGIMAYNHFNAPLGFMVSNCLVYGNRAASIGGGIAGSRNGTPDPMVGVIRDCVIRDNWAYNNAGGVAVYEGNYVYRCTISNNYCAGSGGGLLMLYAAVKSYARNCLIVNNVASNYGGGVFFYYGTAGTYADNCTIAGNTALLGGGGAYFSSGGSLSNSIMYYNMPDNWAYSNTGYRIRYTCTTPRPSGTTYGNITNAPEFVNATTGDYRLQAISPCVNAGRNLSWMTTAGDYAGNPRIRYGTVDMGAYELQDLAALWCDFAANITNAVVDELVTFTASVDGTSSLSPLWYNWSFDNGSSMGTQGMGVAVVSFTYPTNGVFTVNLAVSNSLNLVTNSLKLAYINVVPEPASCVVALVFLACACRRSCRPFYTIIRRA